MQLTIAVCTYNPRQGTLLRALDAIVAQLDTVDSAEILVIDNNSRPPLTERGYLSDYPIRLVYEPKSGLTAAREAAVNEALGDVILFVDDDNILEDGYLPTVVEMFLVDSLLGLLGGAVIPEYETSPPKWFSEFEGSLAIRRYPRELRVETTTPPFSSYFPIGAGFSIRRDLALAYLNDCAETSRIEGRRGSALSSGEDIDLCLFALSRGVKLAVTGALRLIHVISSDRTSREYLERLVVSNIASAQKLESKWSPRLGCHVYPILSSSPGNLLLRTVLTWVLGLFSPRYKIKHRTYATLARSRLRIT